MTIKNCFQHVQISDQQEDEDDVPSSRLRNFIYESDRNEAENISDTVNIEHWKRLQHAFRLDINFDDYVTIDELLPMVDLPYDEEVLKMSP